MEYMERHGSKRSRPDELVPGTLRVISVRMDYLPESQDAAKKLLDDGSSAYISRYALGRDYHKVLRGRLRALARHIEERIGSFGYRVFVDSAPVLEKALAEKAGIGWVGKHTNVIDRDSGSWFFLGELYTNLPLPVDAAEESHCDSCTEVRAEPRATLEKEGFTAEDMDAGLTIFGPVGCKLCNEGYKGRLGIFQVMEVSETMGRIIMEGGNAMQIADQAVVEGVIDLRRAGLNKVQAGLTSLEEINRVTIE